MRLVKLAATAGCTYSRYADDLTFSTNKRDFPSEIAVRKAGAEHLWLPGKELDTTIARAGFTINSSKTHLMYRRSRQVVTGLVVNKKINVRHEYRHTVRAMVNRLVTTGGFEVYGAVHVNGAMTMQKRPGTLNELHGMLGFIDGIHVYNRRHSRNASTGAPSAKELAYREFLMYTTFYAAKAPVIVCEGDTDNVYLTHAIRSLVADFPALASMKDNKVVLNVRIYKYPKSSTARLLDLKAGGTGSLQTFLAAYKKETARFSPQPTAPLIVIYDNDEGASAIRNVAKSSFKVTPAPTDQFTHLSKNLYLIATPLPAGAVQSKIEDFFDAAIKATVLDGKTFSAANHLDKEKEYGKMIFAHKVVRPQADKTDFSGFKPLLTNIVAAIQHFNAHLPKNPV